MLSGFLKQPVTRRWWRLFVISTAIPAVVLGLLSFRAVRLVHFDIQQRASEEQERAARLVDTLLEREFQSQRLAEAAVEFSLALPEDIIVFPRERVYSASVFGRVPREATHQLSESVLDAVEQARTQGETTEARLIYSRIAQQEPSLRDWTDFSLAALNRNGSQTVLPRWVESDALTPSGIPLALIAAETSTSPHFLRRTLDRLRSGSWWLSIEERGFHDGELVRLLHAHKQAAAETDPRFEQTVAAASSIRRVIPRILAGEQRLSSIVSQAGFLLLLQSPDSENPRRGLAIPFSTFASRTGPQLTETLGDTARFATLRDTASGRTIWTGSGSSTANNRHIPLASAPGWELAFSGAASERSLREQQTLWYALIAGLLLTLTSGLYLTLGIVHREMELSKRQSDFVAAVTHEFKSPITSMRLLLERISRGRITSIDIAHEYYDAIDQETLRLDRLVTRLLDSQRMDSGQRECRLAPTDLNELVQTSVDRFKRQAASSSIRIDAQLEPVIAMADATLLSEAVDNLIDNAIRYSGEATTVSVTLSQTATEATIEVTDQGIGIDRKDLAHIFERFYRGKRGDGHNVRGTGLGLSIVKSAAEAHRGSVQVESEPARGSKFTIRIPLETQHAR